jgi:hypothetical protein
MSLMTGSPAIRMVSLSDLNDPGPIALLCKFPGISADSGESLSIPGFHCGWPKATANGRDGCVHDVPPEVTPSGCRHPTTKEDIMPSASKMSTPVALDLEEIQGRYAPMGSYTVAFETYKQDVDPAPLFAGLPDDRCQCEHWGVVMEGQITFRWADREETYVAGDAYYAPAGHLPLITIGTSIVEFSPTEDLDKTMAVIQGNLEKAGVES